MTASDMPPVPRTTALAALLLLVGGVLGAVGLGIEWAEADADFGFVTFTFQYGAFEASARGGSENYDDMDGDGTGRLRAGGPLLAIGMSLAFVALLATGLDLFVPERHIDWVALGAAGLGLLLHLLGLILLATGISAHAAQFGDDARSWLAGLYLAIVAAVVLAAGAGVLAWRRLRARRPEPATENAAWSPGD